MTIGHAVRRLVLAAAFVAGAMLPDSSGAMAQGQWTGFYIGANAGYGWGRFSHVMDFVGTGIAPPLDAVIEKTASGKFGADGFTGGGQLGYNYQAGTLVLGIEADLNTLDRSRSVYGRQPAPFAADDNFRHSFATDWLATVRGRIGVAAGNLMVYMTAGAAFARLESSTTLNYSAGPAGTGSRSEMATGWTIGGGAEYALTRNWTIKGEYLYADLGKVIYSPPGIAAFGFAVTGSNHTTDFTTHIARAGINYKF